MIYASSEDTELNLQPIATEPAPTVLDESVVNAFGELYEVLEHYAPVWYTEEMHEKATAALLALEKSHHSQRSAAIRAKRRSGC